GASDWRIRGAHPRHVARRTQEAREKARRGEPLHRRRGGNRDGDRALLIMPSSHNLLLFLPARVLLALAPGPNLPYLVSRTLAQGRAAGFVSLAGTGSGFLFHILAAAFGLSAVFLAVPIAYDAVRWAGAAYLLWLAWDAIRPSKEDIRK